MKITIKNIEDITRMKYQYNIYDEILIDTKSIKYKNILRYAFKYSLWALKDNGELIISDEPNKTFGRRNNFIDFWQVKYELFKTLKKDIKIINLDNSKGYLKLRKISNKVENNGVSFGIVFSGTESEFIALQSSIESIINMNIDVQKYEIIISGPSSFNKDKLLKYSGVPIRFLEYNFDDNQHRLMITCKKNYILENAKFNIVSINHTRIKYGEDFFDKLINREFDLITTKIIGKVDNKEYPFLDFGLISDYDLSKVSKVRTYVASLIDEKYLNNLKNRVPYIDGGLTVFNKNNTDNLKYNENIAWGEAEDVELCNHAYNNGLLIDYFDDIKCESMVLKFNPKLSLSSLIKHKIIKYLKG